MRLPQSSIALFRLLLWAILLPTLLTGIFAKRGWFDYRRMVQQNEELQAKITVALADKKALEQKIAALSQCKNEQERMVRQTLGFVRPHEFVIEFP